MRLLEIETVSERTQDVALELFEQCTESGWVADGVMSQNSTQAKNLWRLGKTSRSRSASTRPYKNDVSVTVSRVPAFLEEINRIVTEHYPHFEIVWFGHIGDGNLHLNVLKPADMPKEEFFAQCRNVNRWVFEAVARHDGSVSAEHGIGLVKKDYLGVQQDR
jgi:FAD/FMN-containing dehydrogenase